MPWRPTRTSGSGQTNHCACGPVIVNLSSSRAEGCACLDPPGVPDYYRCPPSYYVTLCTSRRATSDKHKQNFRFTCEASRGSWKTPLFSSSFQFPVAHAFSFHFSLLSSTLHPLAVVQAIPYAHMDYRRYRKNCLQSASGLKRAGRSSTRRRGWSKGVRRCMCLYATC